MQAEIQTERNKNRRPRRERRPKTAEGALLAHVKYGEGVNDSIRSPVFGCGFKSSASWSAMLRFLFAEDMLNRGCGAAKTQGC
eukprot:572715-Prorocentrum_minimum.AAC.2